LPVLREVLRYPWRYVAATVAVVSAAVRVARRYGEQPFDELVSELRGGSRRARSVARLRAEARVVSRLVPLLPPWGMGSCLKRSLILLHLWSRSGLRPRIHLGFRPASEQLPRGHAWLSVDRYELAEACGSSGGCAEVLVL
jgi:hypothetical protein